MNKNRLATALISLSLLTVSSTAFAQDGSGEKVAMGAGVGIGLAVIGGALGQGFAARAALEGIARNPNAAGKIQLPMILSLGLIESLVILAFLVTGGFV